MLASTRWAIQKDLLYASFGKLTSTHWFMCVLVAQSCLTLCHPMDCGLPSSSVHGILQARILKWIAIPFSKGYSWPRDRIHVSYIAGRFFTIWATGEAFHLFIQLILQPWQRVRVLLQLDVNTIFSVFLSSDLNQSLWNAGLEIRKYLLKKRYLSWVWKPQKLIRQHYIQDKGNNKCRDAKARSICELRLVPYSGTQEYMREGGWQKMRPKGQAGARSGRTLLGWYG